MQPVVEMLVVLTHAPAESRRGSHARAQWALCGTGDDIGCVCAWLDRRSQRAGQLVQFFRAGRFTVYDLTKDVFNHKLVLITVLMW